MTGDIFEIYCDASLTADQRRIKELEAENAALISALQESAQVMLNFAIAFPIAWSENDQKVFNNARVLAEASK